MAADVDPALDVSSQTLEEALATAYENNPTLSAQRARLRATDEQVPQALSGIVRRCGPSARSAAPISTPTTRAWSARKITPCSREPTERPSSSHCSVAAKPRGDSRRGKHRARGTARSGIYRADVLLDATRLLGRVSRPSRLELTIRNEQRLARQLEAARDRFQVGEVTRTDVSQAEARLARGTSERIGAEGDLAASRAVFRNVIGIAPAVLPRPPLPQILPASLADANDIAIGNNPDVTDCGVPRAQRARFRRPGARRVVADAQPDRAAAAAGGCLAQELTVRSAEALVNLNVPLYQAGAVYSRMRERKQLVVEQRRLLDQSQRNAV